VRQISNLIVTSWPLPCALKRLDRQSGIKFLTLMALTSKNGIGGHDDSNPEIRPIGGVFVLISVVAARDGTRRVSHDDDTTSTTTIAIG
jgi:hypothetical protein